MPKGSSDSLKRKLIKNFKEIKSSKNLQTTQKEKQPKKPIKNPQKMRNTIKKVTTKVKTHKKTIQKWGLWIKSTKPWNNSINKLSIMQKSNVHVSENTRKFKLMHATLKNKIIPTTKWKKNLLGNASAFPAQKCPCSECV